MKQKEKRKHELYIMKQRVNFWAEYLKEKLRKLTNRSIHIERTAYPV